MEQEVYGKEVAQFICELLVCREVPNPPVIPDELEIRDDGVYVKNSYLASDPGEQAFTWTPACEMDWPGAPDPLTAPSLPIPFTAKHLAAFMLDAVGYGIQEKFGRIDGDPDENMLKKFRKRATKVRKVLREAYDLAKQAQSVAGADNYDEQQRAANLLLEYGDARGKAVKRHKVVRTHIDWKRPGGKNRRIEVSREHYLHRLDRVNRVVAPQKSEAESAQAEANERHEKWRKTMVHQLLHATLPDLSCTTIAPLPDELDYSLLATPTELLDAFGKWGLMETWFDDLNSRKWLLNARRKKGQGTRGQVLEPLFCPYAVMTGLIEKVRKKSRIQPDTGWRTLEHKFPKVYAAYEDYDPRERTGD